MCRPACLVFTLVLICSACGGESAPKAGARVAEAVTALEGEVRVLDEEHHAPGWMTAGLAPFQEGLQAIRSGSPTVKPVTPDVARRRLRAADVVAVADLHDFDLARVALGRLIEELADPTALSAGRVAIALEAVPAGSGEHVEDLVRRRDREGLRAFFRRHWPWPVDAYVDLLLRPRLRGLRVLGAGGAGQPPVPPGPEVEDAERTPTPVIRLGMGDAMSVHEAKYGTSFTKNNSIAAYAVTRYLEAGEGPRQVFVLYGAAHLLDEPGLAPSGIVPQLADAGWDAVVVAPFFPSWELALRRRFGRAAEGAWFEVREGVLRPPHATAQSILDMLAS